MSGIVTSNVFRSSGVIAATAAGINFQSSVVTGSTLSVEAGNGYFINTTSNICTVTLPGSAEAGDQIVLVDFARTWGTNKIVIDSNGLNFQGRDDTYGVEYSTSGATVNIVYSGATKGWTPISDDVVALEAVITAPVTQKALIFSGYNNAGAGSLTSKNLINSSGVVASDSSTSGAAFRTGSGGAGYGGDKAIFGYGGFDAGNANTRNLVSNQGVVGSDTSGAGTARQYTSAVGYGADKAIFYGGSGPTNVSNLVSNSGVLAADTTGVGSARSGLASTAFGGDGRALFAFGDTGSVTNVSNKVSDQGVVATDTTGVGTARSRLGGATYGTDKGLFVYGGSYTNHRNLVSNSGVVASDTTATGTGRQRTAGMAYGGDKAIIVAGLVSGASPTGISNLVNNSGVVASDVSAVTTARYFHVGAGYSTSA